MIGTKNINLGEGSVKKLVFKLALPAVLAQIVNLLYNIVDRIYIGNMEGGEIAMGGMGIALPIITIIMAFASLISIGGAARASIYMGQGEKDKAERIVGNSFITLIFASIILTAVVLIFNKPILIFFGASDANIQYALDYINIYAVGTIFVQIALGMNAYITCQGFTSVSMKTVLIGAVINIILDPIFIYTLNLGVKGAAIATIIAQSVSAIWVFVFFIGKKTNLKLKVQNFHIDLKLFLPCLALGMSMFIMQSTEAIIMICFNRQMDAFGGELAVSSMTVLTSIMQFSMLPMIGLLSGVQPIISYNYGARKPDRVKSAFKIVLICCIIFTTSIWGIVQFFPEILVKMFNSDPLLVEKTARLLKVYLSVNFLFGAQMACQQTFVALGRAKISLFLALFRKIVLLIPLIFIVPEIFVSDKVLAVVLAEPITDCIAVVTTVILFAINFPKIMKSIEGNVCEK